MLVSHIEWYQCEEQQRHELQRSPNWWKKSTVTVTANVHQEKVKEGWKQGEVLSSHHRPHSAMPLLSSIFLALSSKTMYRGNGFSPVEREERRKLPARPTWLYHSCLHQQEWYKFSSVAVGRHSPIRVHWWEEWSFIFGTQKNHLASLKSPRSGAHPESHQTLWQKSLFFFC